MTTFAQKTGTAGLALLFAAGGAAFGGEQISPAKQVEQPATPSDWSFELAVPGWLANTSGTTGINGLNSHVYLGVGDLLQHTDMISALSAEARKGPFGVYGDMLYVSASDNVQMDGLLHSVYVRLDQWIVDLEANYRLLDGPRGYLDLRAGVRYTNIFSKLQITPDDSAIDHASAAFVDNVSRDINRQLQERLSQIDLAGFLRNALNSRVQTDITDRLAVIDGKQRPTLPIAPLEGREPSRLREIIDRIIDRKLNDLASALRSEAQAEAEAVDAEATAKTEALKAAATAKAQAIVAAAQQRVAALKQQISNQIASALKSGLNQTGTLAESWWDPYVGFRFRYNLSKAFYLTGKADIGGFGVGSELTWQASGAIGCQLTRYIYSEVGYRYLYTDYNQGGFLYDITQSGFQITTGILF